MPNRATHQKLGAAAGGVGALYHAREQGWQDALIEVGGGVVGGMVGGMLPDRLDPPLSPRHRDVFHSTVLFAVLLLLVIEAQREVCRQRAMMARIGPGRPSELESAAWRFLCGFLTGLQWGYVSHLAADLTTSAGLPVVDRTW